MLASPGFSTRYHYGACTLLVQPVPGHAPEPPVRQERRSTARQICPTPFTRPACFALSAFPVPQPQRQPPSLACLLACLPACLLRSAWIHVSIFRQPAYNAPVQQCSLSLRSGRPQRRSKLGLLFWIRRRIPSSERLTWGHNGSMRFTGPPCCGANRQRRVSLHAVALPLRNPSPRHALASRALPFHPCLEACSHPRPTRYPWLATVDLCIANLRACPCS